MTDALRWVESLLGAPITQVRDLPGGMTGVMLAVTTAGDDSAVLRLITNEPWRSSGTALATRESQIQRMLAESVVPAPMSLGLDATGERCGHPAHLMTMVPGAVDPDRVDETSLIRLAKSLAAIHDVQPSIEVRPYQSWAWDAKYVVPEWAGEPRAWATAFELLRSEPPGFDPVFLHRDFSLRNVLWSAGAVTGIVDWVETSIGPAWLDVAHCCTNLALRHGNAVADDFARVYIDGTGRGAQAYWDVMDVVGFLPVPGRAGVLELTDMGPRGALEQRLLHVLDQG